MYCNSDRDDVALCDVMRKVDVTKMLCGTVQCTAMQQCNIVNRNAIKWKTVQCSAVQDSTVQYRTVQCSL